MKGLGLGLLILGVLAALVSGGAAVGLIVAPKTIRPDWKSLTER